MSRPVKLLSISIALVCLLLALNFGLRSSMGFFMAPISNQFGYGREVFVFALALQNVWWAAGDIALITVLLRTAIV